MKQKYKFSIVLDDLYAGYPDLYNGHGHVFESENFVACIGFSIPITYNETVKEIIEAIKEDINNYIEPIQFFTEDKEIIEAIRDFVTDEVIEQAFKEYLGKDIKDNDEFFNVSEEDRITEEEAENIELPLLIGHFHIYLEQD